MIREALQCLGVTPWMPSPQLFANQADDLLRGSGRYPALAPGRALVLGCTSGEHAVHLARLGWQVDNLERVGLVVWRAKRTVGALDGSLTFRTGNLDELPMAAPYDLVLDLGWYHGLGNDERSRYAQIIEARTTPSASLLMYCYQAAARIFLPSGASRRGVERVFDRWQLTLDLDAATPQVRPGGNPADPRWFRLDRRISGL